MRAYIVDYFGPAGITKECHRDDAVGLGVTVLDRQNTGFTERKSDGCPSQLHSFGRSVVDRTTVDSIIMWGLLVSGACILTSLVSEKKEGPTPKDESFALALGSNRFLAGAGKLVVVMAGFQFCQYCTHASWSVSCELQCLGWACHCSTPPLTKNLA